MPSDEDLMERYQGGDQAAFRMLFQRHARRVHGFLLRHTGDRSRADDLLQQTWLKLHRARDSYRPGAPFSPWLYTIAANTRRDAARADGRSAEELTSDGETPGAAAAPIDRSEAADLHERIRAALAALPEGQREVILLHRVQELSFAEVAQVVGASEGAVRVRAHRGYVALRRMLAPPDAGAREERSREGGSPGEPPERPRTARSAAVEDEP
jgi:RNA polymerase sigma factor (sigma-70 family)